MKTPTIAEQSLDWLLANPALEYQAAEVGSRSVTATAMARAARRLRLASAPAHDGRGDELYGVRLSPNTVTTYRARILEKMGMASNADLTRYALQNGLI